MESLQSVVAEYIAERGLDADEDLYAVVCEALDKPGRVRDYFQRQLDGLDYEAITKQMRSN